MRELVRRAGEHARHLVDMGMTKTEVAEHAGIGVKVISKLMNGGSVSDASAEKVLGVAYDPNNPCQWAKHTVAAVRMMAADGVPLPWIADRAGVSVSTIRDYRFGVRTPNGVRAVGTVSREAFDGVGRAWREYRKL